MDGAPWLDLLAASRKPDPRGAVLGPIDNVFTPAREHVVEQQETEELLADIQVDTAPRRSRTAE
ncbi:hypothetical protein [Actinomyces naeslundii]|uniref:hypothetical protein n=1 Tax=Actinomyces naeslundii TaxID=1655 RepID=UPI00209B14AA|nr:hypothetical protein [Actinomyces naeslundii]